MSGPVAARLRLACVTRKPHSASFEHRVRDYLPDLARAGIDVDVHVLPSTQSGQRTVIDGLGGYDAVWWHRSLVAPWQARRARRAARRLVIDYDDPLPYSSRGGGKPSLARRIRFASLVKRCDAALVASDYLRELAAPYCANVVVLPMAIEVDATPPRARASGAGAVRLLWLGSAATQPYLERLRDPLAALGRSRPAAELRLVGHRPMRFDPLRVDYRPWSHVEQAAALRECDIGLCPMPDTIWTRGKCPFKTLQYMAAGMPWVGSAVGENVALAGRGSDARGVCATTDDGWREALEALVDDAPCRAALGRNGHAHVLAHHERSLLAERLIAFWRALVDGDAAAASQPGAATSSPSRT